MHMWMLCMIINSFIYVCYVSVINIQLKLFVCFLSRTGTPIAAGTVSSPRRAAIFRIFSVSIVFCKYAIVCYKYVIVLS